MDEPKFTPGTWSLNHESYGVHIEPSIAWIGFGTAHTETEHKANAALIVAAPEMYEFIEWLRSVEGQCAILKAKRYLPQILDKLDEILKKARGEV